MKRYGSIPSAEKACAKIYTAHNARGAVVFDVEATTQLERVLRIDTASGEVVCAHQPARIDQRGELQTVTLRFRAIHPIFAGQLQPCLFHCYGRIETPSAPADSAHSDENPSEAQAEDPLQESSICYRIEWPEGWPQAAERPRFTTSFEVAKTRCRQGAVVTPVHEPLEAAGACKESAKPDSRLREECVQ
ncbi:hypothetical protein [Variovorax sp. UMC13]|uniref:hypothetical protein n=1 Tax=Variovorax sp. UMC13 TaxID=1862326 RepID=UPI001600BB03|nr:hypothetical protein [Variovorax sp. UMC13]MBB1602002.1 hypothetical protein [Variovorax sp. UMC13]